jgi:hypothetical protein
VTAPRRDAFCAGLAVIAAVVMGSRGLADVDPALLGYLAATLVTVVACVHRASAFWRRPAAAVYARAVAGALARPRRLRVALRAAGRDLVAQRSIAGRGRARWLAHLALSGGTLGSFAITIPLVWGWLRFQAEDPATYRVVVAGLPTVRLAVGGAAAWVAFHGLVLCAVAVVLGASYFLVARVRARGTAGGTDGFHLGPLVLLLLVAATGLVLPIAAHSGTPTLFRAAAAAHEATVVLFLVALPATKLGHLLVRPLQVGVRLVKASGQPVRCVACGGDAVPAAQATAVQRLLARRGLPVTSDRTCPACRRRRLAGAHARLLAGDFQPRPATNGVR